MKSLKSLFAAAAALFICFSGSAAPVGTNDAARAVRAWVRRGGTLGARLGQDVTSVGIHATTNGVKFYSVQTRGGGTVFTSADDALEPILAFTSENAAEAARNPNSPLYALLNRDVVARTPSASKLKLTTSSVTKSKWAALLSEADKDEADAAKGKLKLTTRSSVPSVGDLRVPPLVETKWGQTTDGYGNPCYNYYMCCYTQMKNYPCGCVATAMAQVMRYHQWPQASRATVQKTCYIDNKAYYFNTVGGTYDWANMPLDPNGEDTETMTGVPNEAIGRLCYDAGVSVRMNWCEGGSSAYSVLLGEALRDVFGYGSAYSSMGKKTVEDADGIAHKILSNLGAGYPVLLGIAYREGSSAQNGHTIVGDGYGYNDEALYVHLNMGWSGLKDLWYQLPAMSEDFNSLDEIAYNIIPDGADDKAVVSGRITVPSGAPASGALVAIHVAGSATALTNVTANAYGVYGVVLPSGQKYEARATVGALQGTATMSNALASPTLENRSFNVKIGTTPVTLETTKYAIAAGNEPALDVVVTGTPSGNPLVWTESTTLNATQFAAFTHTFSVTGGTAPYAWSATDIPSGLALDKILGTLSGAPTQAGEHVFDVTATDAFGKSLTKTFTLVVAEPENQKPVIKSIEGRPESGLMYLKSGVEQDFTVKFYDPDGDAMQLNFYVNGELRCCVDAHAVSSPSTFSYPYTFSHTLKSEADTKRDFTLRVTLSDSSWPEQVSDSWEIRIFWDEEPVPPGGDVKVPSGYATAEGFAEALNNGTANKADYLKVPGNLPMTSDYLSCFSAVPSGETTVTFVLNDDGTNAVEAATEVAATNALAAAISPSVTTLTIADPLVGFYYSLKQGGVVTNLHFNAEGDRNKLGGRDEISFDLSKPEGAGFYQPLVTPTEYGD